MSLTELCPLYFLMFYCYELRPGWDRLGCFSKVRLGFVMFWWFIWVKSSYMKIWVMTQHPLFISWSLSRRSLRLNCWGSLLLTFLWISVWSFYHRVCGLVTCVALSGSCSDGGWAPKVRSRSQIVCCDRRSLVDPESDQLMIQKRSGHNLVRLCGGGPDWEKICVTVGMSSVTGGLLQNFSAASSITPCAEISVHDAERNFGIRWW